MAYPHINALTSARNLAKIGAEFGRGGVFRRVCSEMAGLKLEVVMKYEGEVVDLDGLNGVVFTRFRPYVEVVTEFGSVHVHLDYSGAKIIAGMVNSGLVHGSRWIIPVVQPSEWICGGSVHYCKMGGTTYTYEYIDASFGTDIGRYRRRTDKIYKLWLVPVMDLVDE